MTLAEFPYIDAVQSMRFVTCPECALLHAVPSALFEACQQSRRSLHCPQGHAWTPAAPRSDDDSNPAQTLSELRSNVSELQTKLNAALRRVEVLTPLAAPTPKELRRRSHALALRAEAADDVRAVCPFCSRIKGRDVLAEHLRRRHPTELAGIPAASI